MELRVLQGNLDKIQEHIPFEHLMDYLNTPSQNWLDISDVSENDYDRLSETLGIPRLLVESRLSNECYPQIDYFEHYSLIFARVTDGGVADENFAGITSGLNDLLVVCHGNDIITISKSQTDMFNKIHDRARKIYGPEEPLAVTILYTILKYMIEEDRRIIADVERHLVNFESQPLKKRPANFLEITFALRKELNQLITALLHFREIISEITMKSVPLEGFTDRHERRFHILADEVSYVYEAASFARDNLIYLVDLYMNTTAYETNKVMRVIAVITSLGILPAIFGLLGSNIAGNPWDIQLWQVFGILAIFMMIAGLIFYRLGWFKGN